MSKIWCFIFTACVSVKLSQVKDIFSKNADDLMKEVLGDVLKLNINQGATASANIEDDYIFYQNTLEAYNNTISTTTSTTEKDIYVRIKQHVPKKSNGANITMEHVRRRMALREVDALLEQKVSPLSNLQNKEDETIAITRRFNRIREESSTTELPALREIFHSNENATAWFTEKNRTISLMEQFIYATRYRLPYAQLLRKKYMHDVKYKLGYCFALLRTLKQQQMMIYNVYKNQYERFMNPHIHFKLYEKVVRLDVDIKDLIKYIKQLEYQRKKIEFPDYYYFFSSSTGRVWRR